MSDWGSFESDKKEKKKEGEKIEKKEKKERIGLMSTKMDDDMRHE